MNMIIFKKSHKKGKISCLIIKITLLKCLLEKKVSCGILMKMPDLTKKRKSIAQTFSEEHEIVLI